MIIKKIVFERRVRGCGILLSVSQSVRSPTGNVAPVGSVRGGTVIDMNSCEKFSCLPRVYQSLVLVQVRVQRHLNELFTPLDYVTSWSRDPGTYVTAAVRQSSFTFDDHVHAHPIREDRRAQPPMSSPSPKCAANNAPYRRL
jgi:hypothetical protein